MSNIVKVTKLYEKMCPLCKKAPWKLKAHERSGAMFTSPSNSLCMPANGRQFCPFFCYIKFQVAWIVQIVPLHILDCIMA